MGIDLGAGVSGATADAVDSFARPGNEYNDGTGEADLLEEGRCGVTSCQLPCGSFHLMRLVTPVMIRFWVMLSRSMLYLQSCLFFFPVDFLGFWPMMKSLRSGYCVVVRLIIEVIQLCIGCQTGSESGLSRSSLQSNCHSSPSMRGYSVSLYD